MVELGVAININLSIFFQSPQNCQDWSTHLRPSLSSAEAPTKEAGLWNGH